MLYLLIVLFLIAALFGAYLYSYILADKETPKGIAVLHGLFAGTGIILLGLYSFYNSLSWISFIILILAACGGFFMLLLDLSGKKIPKFIPAVHGFIALMGVLFLVSLLFK